MKQLLTLSLLFFLLNGVYASSSGKLLSQEQMVSILVDLELAKAILCETDHAGHEEASQMFEAMIHIIYQMHAIKAEMLQKSYLYYLNHPKLMQRIYALVIVRLEELLDACNH